MPEAVEVLLARELQAEAEARTCFDARERETKRRLVIAPPEFEIPALMIEPEEEPAAFRRVGGEKDAPVPVAACFATLPVARGAPRPLCRRAAVRARAEKRAKRARRARRSSNARYVRYAAQCASRPARAKGRSTRRCA
jgi:hypothetical protein